MNNLLRTLTASQVKSSLPDTDLKLLLSAVKETRRQSSEAAKLADGFYDSLEGLLVDLRTVTIDSHDAEAFLKPVSRTEVPDYHDIIANPMDLGTMLRKVKQKQYKSKRDFKDDLDLIWSNCYTYNSTENHPLRQCAKRLQVKAEKLLKNITDCKERADPPIPADVAIRTAPRTNGVTVNGHTWPHTPGPRRSPSPTKVFTLPTGTSRSASRNLPFPDTPAIVRTPAGMARWRSLDDQLARVVEQSGIPNGAQLHERDLPLQLSQYAVAYEDDDEEMGSPSPEVRAVDGDIGAKRKLNGFLDNRPRKRPRMQSPAERDVTDLWWSAIQSDELLGNGLPTLLHASSEPIPPSIPPHAITDHPREGMRKRKKKKKEVSQDTMLYYMNNNIRTLKRVRSTHAKFSALKQSTEEGAGPSAPPEPPEDDVVDVVDERPWRPLGSGIEIGEENADDCMHWTSRKILEHSGFQGTSKVALDVLAGVASEYLLNVGRTIHFLSEKYAGAMTAEEIVLHTLFESGVTRIHELERYITDDVIRYGGRLAELEKKLATAYREATTEEAWDDEALFANADDGEEDSQFVMGGFTESFGEDFLGLRELGIASELGLSSLSVPKKLLKGKRSQGTAEGPSAAKPSEPPPPFPPPPPFIPLSTPMVDHQIGLLKPYYQQRISALSTSIMSSAPPGQLPTPGPSIDPSTLVLPDDPPTPAHAKLGPLGQVLKPAPSAAAKKKPKGKDTKGGAPIAPPLTSQPSESQSTLVQSPDAPLPGSTLADSPKKAKTPGAAANGKKKAGSKPADALPPTVMASA